MDLCVHSHAIDQILGQPMLLLSCQRSFSCLQMDSSFCCYWCVAAAVELLLTAAADDGVTWARWSQSPVDLQAMTWGH